MKFTREFLGLLAVLLLLMAASPYVMPFIANMHVPTTEGVVTFIIGSFMRIGWFLGMLLFYLPNLLFQQLPIATPLQLVYPVPFLVLIIYLLADLAALKKFVREQRQEHLRHYSSMNATANRRPATDPFHRQRLVEDERKKKIEDDVKLDDQDKARRSALFQSTLSRYVEKYHAAKRASNEPGLEKLKVINAKLLSPAFRQFVMSAEWGKVEAVVSRIVAELDVM